MKKITFFTGKLGGYEACRRLLHLIDDDPSFELSIIAADQHHTSEFGNTAQEIKFPPSQVQHIKMYQAGASPSNRLFALNNCMYSLIAVLMQNKPDLFIYLGDRGETLMAATVCLHLGIPTAHIQGGDYSGGLDQPLRDAITCMSRYHFVSTKTAAYRVGDLIPARVYLDRIIKVVGDPHIDDILDYPGNLDKKNNIAIFHYHPDDHNPTICELRTKDIRNALQSLSLDIVTIGPCSDIGYSGVLQGHDNMSVPYLPRQDYLRLMSTASLIIGNSSAGIIEAPYLGLPCVNVGDRQKGRLCSDNVIHPRPYYDELVPAIQAALKLKGPFDKPYGNGTANQSMYEWIKELLV